ncbi:MAG TPA: hypothetical protein DET40_00305 [Lentisphaeria bacterium]|nr:MAG: hypothetical protein A2X45_10780 [Lentisphaerae bacterium GWF2_50_93]HCE41974.1 hypothetical protein [Lentisphaeria bacterium]
MNTKSQTTEFQKKLPDMLEGSVTFLDILGWKGIWTRNVKAAERLLALINSIDEHKQKLQENLAVDNIEYRGLNTTIKSISDTIVLSTPGSPVHSAKLHGHIISFAIIESLKQKLPIRGATAYGQFSIKENIMIGPAIDEAAEWYEATDWIGVIQTPSAEFKYREETEDIWMKYDVKYKQIGRYDSYALNWCKKWNEEYANGKETLHEIFSQMGPISTSVSIKYKNTLEFYDKMTKSDKDKAKSD